jgi:hypothetical protein
LKIHGEKWLQKKMITVYKKTVHQTFKKARVVVSGNQIDADLADIFLPYPKKTMR